MYMFKYVMKRLGLALMTFVVIMLMSFVLIKLVPMEINVGLGKDLNLALKQLEGYGYIICEWNGDVCVSYRTAPILSQLFSYLKNIFVNGDFGVGINLAKYRYKPVWDIFVQKLPPTILINIYSSLIGVPIGLGLGIYAALKKNKWQDQVINIVIILLISLPSIVFAVLIQYFPCYKWGLFPVKMNAGTDYLSWSMFVSMLPAVFALTLGPIAGYARYTRAELSEVLTGEFMLLARTKGLTRGQATLRHAMRNSMVVIFPSILSEFITVLSGSLIIEQMFSIPGVGGLYLESILALDYDFFMLLSGFYCLIGLLAGIVIDISYGFIDPRIRMGAR